MSKFPCLLYEIPFVKIRSWICQDFKNAMQLIIFKLTSAQSEISPSHPPCRQMYLPINEFVPRSMPMAVPEAAMSDSLHQVGAARSQAVAPRCCITPPPTPSSHNKSHHNFPVKQTSRLCPHRNGAPQTKPPFRPRRPVRGQGC